MRELLQHHILTRFNLRTSAAYSDAWFENRIALFERYTLPSIAAQTKRGFTWHLFFDAERTAPYMGKIEDLGLLSVNAKTHFLDVGENVVDVLKALLHDTTRPLLTSRVDNDDILHPNYVARLHDAARIKLEHNSTEPVLLDFRTNYMWTQNEPKMIRRRVSYPTAFVSLLEPLRSEDGYKTVFAGRHSRLHEKFRLKKLPFDGGIAVVHGDNILNQTALHPSLFRRLRNKLRGKANWVRPQDVNAILSDFNVSASLV